MFSLFFAMRPFSRHPINSDFNFAPGRMHQTGDFCCTTLQLQMVGFFLLDVK